MLVQLIMSFLTGLALGAVGTYNLLLAPFLGFNSPVPVFYQPTGTYVVPPPTSTMGGTPINYPVSSGPPMVASVLTIFCVVLVFLACCRYAAIWARTKAAIKAQEWERTLERSRRFIANWRHEEQLRLEQDREDERLGRAGKFPFFFILSQQSNPPPILSLYVIALPHCSLLIGKLQHVPKRW